VSTVENMASQPLGIQQDDVVRLVDTGELAIVDHVGGETSDEDDGGADSEGSFEHLPLFESDALHLELQNHGVNGNSTQRRGDAGPRQHLIRRYDDDGDADDEEDDNADGEQPGDDHLANQENRNEDMGNDAAAPTDALYDRESLEDVPVGSARVLLVESGHDMVLALDKLAVEDRSFIPGEIVYRRLRNQPSQSAATEQEEHLPQLSAPSHSQTQGATIIAVTKALLVRKVSPQSSPPSRRHVMRVPEQPTFEISSEHLGFISGLRDGCFVVLDNWMGRVTFFNEVVDVRFSDGSVCQVHGHPSELLPADVEDDAFLDDVEGVYYPGQFVKAEPEVWRSATWLSGSYSRELIGAIVSVEVVDVGVDWMATKYTEELGAEDETPPSDIVPASDLTPLGAFRALWWRVGDRGLYVGGVPGGAGSPEVPGTGLGSRTEVDEDGEWEVVDGDDNDGSGHPDGQHNRPRSGAPRRRRSVSRSATGRLTAPQRRLPRQTQNATAAALDHASNEHVVEVINTKTYLDLMWQDGSKSCHVPAVTVLRNHHLGAYDYFPGLFVSEAQDDLELDRDIAANPASDLVGEANARGVPKRIGVVVRVNHAARTAVVRWQIGDKCEYGPDEEVSVYELSEHGVYDIRLGDTVLRVPSQNQEPASRGNAVTQIAWVGEVVGIGIGVLDVAWHNGGRESVTPDCLLVVGGDDEDGGMEEEEIEDDDPEDENSGRDAHQQWASALFPPHSSTDERPDGREESQALDFSENWGDDEANNIQTPHTGPGMADTTTEQQASLTVARLVSQALDEYRNTSVLRGFDPQLVGRAAALEALIEVSGTGRLTVQRIVEAAVRHALAMSRGSNIHSSGTTWPGTEYWSQLDLVLGNKLQIVLTRLGIKSVDDGTTLSSPNGLPLAPAENNGSSAVSVASRPASSDDVPVAATVTELSGEYADIERFAIVDELPLHHYSSGSSTDRPPAGGFAGVVRKEWTRLTRHLPAGIFVHATESRLDLLRAAIVGPADTPYADGLFFFDIVLPGDYPSTPPKVQFMSHGRRLNPNLYEDGKVCLSILGTWDGEGVEKWDPRNSNVLRVLLSLQAMVFVEEPYYNEAGYEKQVATTDGQANSRLYNESTLLLSLRHIVSTLRPGGAPQDFLDLMRLHYRLVGVSMLERCRALMDSEPVTCPVDSQSVTGTAWRRGRALKVDDTSVGFKRSLASLLPKVQSAFDELGTDVP
jgi:ubiquitin-protein ligase